MFGVIQQLRGQNFAIFDPPPYPLLGQFLYPGRGQKQNFLTPSPLILFTFFSKNPEIFVLLLNSCNIIASMFLLPHHCGFFIKIVSSF